MYTSFVIVFTLFLSGCSVSNWNLGKTTTKEMPQTENKPQGGLKEESETKKAENSNFHIDTIINTWGQPTYERTNPQGKKVYIWENCKPTGVYIDRCDSNGCETVPETQCCERALETDNNGYVQNLKEAINSCI
ncbi:hypothetical protein CRN67_07405 [Campylobacter blaseri]|uniref:Uncharacterized protein n=1 Tax=Campylobacter blaseri TaxID=2042961 RepID=A0A2P8QZH6_9BACT|nr:hypothetical protein CQ405_07400 [Campylobacter blaseri]PSM53449.1 hypothetical protein CRN67_07405 [Campylobacter blaseri]